MATTICNVLTVTISPLDNTVPAAARTYTATRSLRLYDLKAFLVDDPAPGTYTCMVLNQPPVGGANTALTLQTALNPDQGDIFRLGQNAADTANDAFTQVSAGSTCVFVYNDNDSIRATLYCWPL